MKIFYQILLHWTERDLIAARSTGRNPDNIAHLSSLVSQYESKLIAMEINCRA